MSYTGLRAARDERPRFPFSDADIACVNCVHLDKTLRSCTIDAPTPLRQCINALIQKYCEYIVSRKYRRVLEIGCGSSSRLLGMAEGRFEWAGVDIQRRYRGQPSVATHLASVSDLPFEDSTYDCVVANQSIEHWYEWGVSIKQGLTEISRVLVVGGVAFIDAPVHFHGHRVFRRGNMAEIVDHLRLVDSMTLERVERWRQNSHPLAPYYPSVNTPPWLLPEGRVKPAWVVSITFRKTGNPDCGRSGVHLRERARQLIYSVPVLPRLTRWTHLGGFRYLCWRIRRDFGQREGTFHVGPQDSE